MLISGPLTGLQWQTFDIVDSFYSWTCTLRILLNILMWKHFACQQKHVFFLKKIGPIPASFSFIFGLFKQTIQFLQQINVKKSCPSSIRCWDSNSWPSEHESPPITSHNRDWKTCGDPYNVCLLIWVAKLETSHVLQSNKNKSYRGRSDRLSVSIQMALQAVLSRGDEMLPHQNITQ